MWQARNTLLCSAYGLGTDYCKDSLFSPLIKDRSCLDINMAVEKDLDGND